MVNLALVIFFCTLLNQIVSWVGKSVLQEIAFTAYSWVFLSSTAAKQRKLRKQVLEDKAELGRTSSQDEFAKWAKLRRKLDKGLADLEKTSNSYISGLTCTMLTLNRQTTPSLHLAHHFRRNSAPFSGS